MTDKNYDRQSFMAKIKASLFNSKVKPGLAALLLITGINSSSITANSLEKTPQETKVEKPLEENKPASNQSQNQEVVEKTVDTLELNAAEPNTTDSNTADSQQEDTDDQTSANENSVSSQPDSTNSNSDDSVSQIPDSIPSSHIIDLNQWRFLHQYSASYDVISDGDRLGRASRTLIKDDKGWKLEISTKLKKWLLTLRSNEFSRFRIVDNQLKTDEFYTSTKVSFKDPRIIQQHFDWEKQLEQGSRNKRKWELPLENLLYDRMSHFVKLRADLLSDTKDFKYMVSYKGSRKSYVYVANGNEVLKTPMGNIETIRFDRVSGDDSSFSIWLSPDYNFFPIKIAQIEQDKPDVTLALTKLEFVQDPTISE
ncbi:MAG: DUF3108 domain-containing protein [Kangiellaceae bacterium]|nr:DUF3108 domain-containing protein [Kangiellaceae bacterium]MCW8998154.1 DUF3108 domain-containing protein [Kangiellaceae bacterium]